MEGLNTFHPIYSVLKLQLRNDSLIRRDFSISKRWRQEREEGLPKPFQFLATKILVIALQKILNPDKSNEGGFQLIIGLLKVGSFSEET